MEHDLNGDLDRRLRAARPVHADIEDAAFDGALLARVQQLPVDARRRVPRSLAMPVAAGAIAIATAAVVLGGVPGNVGGPASAAAITQQTLQWLDPAPGTILHARSVETMGERATTREIWQSADDPSAEREVVSGDRTFEVSDGALYDAATNTVYDTPPGASVDRGANAGPLPAGKGPAQVTGDPVVFKVRTLLERGDLVVGGRELHDGIDCWKISLRPDVGRPVWTLWVSVAEGKPVELQDPGRDASEPAQDIRWPVYEVVPADAAAQALLTVAGAHPGATVVDDPARVEAGWQQLQLAG